MRDALGGSVTIVIIVVFIVIVLGYLAFNVNYTKAFRMKNKIISTYEEYNGVCDGVNTTSTSANSCFDKITDYARDVGYQPGELDCAADYHAAGSYYCYKEIKINSEKDAEEKGVIYEKNNSRVYYKIATRINIQIPIIQNVFNMQLFWVTGDTKSFEVK